MKPVPLLKIGQVSKRKDELVSLRWLLSSCEPSWSQADRLHIFKQIATFVDLSHSQSLVLGNVRPSSFLISPSNRVSFLDCSDSPLNSSDQSPVHALLPSEDNVITNNDGKDSADNDEDEEDVTLAHDPEGIDQLEDRTQQRYTSNRESTSSPDNLLACTSKVFQSSSTLQKADSADLKSEHLFPLKKINMTEQALYKSPEELSSNMPSIASDIYCLGMLLFELFCSFESEAEWSKAMLDLRHRLLPPRFLLDYPKEASLCLLLLHHDPSVRPKARNILGGELLSGVVYDLEERQALLSIEEMEAGSELLSYFLHQVQIRKLEEEEKVIEDFKRVTCDINEVERQSFLLGKLNVKAESSMGSMGNEIAKRPRLQEQFHMSPGNSTQVSSENRISILSMKQAHVMSQYETFKQIYCSMNPTRDRSETEDENVGLLGRLGCFFASVRKYTRYSKLQVKATLQHGDSLNVVSSLSFDRDEEYFATAAFYKGIKIFKWDSVLNPLAGLHYPVIELPSSTKVSSVCWNTYVKNYIASSNFEGAIQIWDAEEARNLCELREHSKRAWSVDFCRADPMKLASGSDDCSVKIWSINQRKSVETIKSRANVCCVQFSPNSSHLLAFGCADYRIYCHDLRNSRVPLHIFLGHKKAVSFVRFMAPTMLVSASTDSTLKLWDTTKKNGSSSTFSGHTNQKNFVGLSVAEDGYIACGSETNEVFVYYKSLPMPLLSHKLGMVDPISGQELEDDSRIFVSSVCWKGKSQTLLAANSGGNIKVLEMI